MTPTEINTAPQAIDALGGTAAVARLLGTSYNAVNNWRTRGLPKDTYVALERALAEKGFTVSASLWRQRGAA